MALLLAGLFVLGLVCGERAHAVESTGTLGDTAAATREVQPLVTGLGMSEQGLGQAHRLVRPATEPSAEPATEPAAKRTTEPAAKRTTEPTVKPTAKPTLKTADEAVEEAVDRAAGEQTGEQVGESVVRPVGRLVDRGTGTFSTVSSSTDPDLPELPGLSGLPALPEPPGFPKIPAVRPLPSGALPVGDGTQASQGATDDQSRGEAAVEDGAWKSPDAACGPVYGPHTRIALAPGQLTISHDGGAVRPVHLPDRTPGGVPTGAIDQSLFDTTSPRHGDLHAASFAEGGLFRLVPGGTAATDGAGVRDRHRDINEFPG